MLDIDTLNALHDLMATTLYQAEVNRLPKLSRSEEQDLVTRARRHDSAARATLIVSCLAYALGKAIILFLSFRPEHEEVSDLVQVASETMLKRLDYALAKSNPASYLRAVAKKSILMYLFYYSDLIRKPNLPLAELATKHIPVVESLDIPAFRESTTLKIDLIQKAPMPTQDKSDERFSPLYDALKHLTPVQRNEIAKTYKIGEIDPTVRINGVHPDTLSKLRKELEPHLKQMLE